MEIKRFVGGLALAFATTSTLLAHDEPFGYLRGAQTEAKGEWEVVQWSTARIGKESGRYLGLDLPHPLIPGASPLADHLDSVRRLEDAGAAAIVLRSLFEEQILREQTSALQHWTVIDDDRDAHSETRC